MYRCVGARAGVTLPRAGAELCVAAATLGCGLQREPCGAAVSLPQVTRAQPELPLEPGVGTAATSCHHLLWTHAWGWPGQCRLLQHVRAGASTHRGRGSKGNLAGSFSRGRWRTHFFYSPNSTFLLQRINPITNS